MTKPRVFKIRISQDLLWKAIIEDSIEDFLTYFYPQAHEIFDFNKGFEFLDNELQKISPKSKNKNRVSDRLIKVFLKDGQEKWILIHIEVQGYFDPEFPLRMFTYFYRIFDKFKKPITAIALLTDDNQSFHPNSFSLDFLETKLDYQFKTLKLSDCKLEDLKNSTNPFAIVLETAWHGLKKNALQDEKNRLKLAIDLARRMLKKGFSKDSFYRMCHFIESYVHFEDSNTIVKFEENINTIAKTSKPMGIIELVTTETKRQVREFYMKEGKREGRKLGIKEGKLEGKLEGADEKARIATPKLYLAGFSIAKIADILEVQQSFVIQILKENNLQ